MTDRSIIFFYGEKKKYREFSNFYPCTFRSKCKCCDGTTYTSSEQYMMAHKAILFKDDASYKRILKAKTPMEAKKLGRKVINFNEEKWKKVRTRIVILGLTYKFSSDPKLKKVLLDTGNAILVEASPRDKIWGIGMGEKKGREVGIKGWKGTNLLGKCLMKVRDDLI